ncbi:hypothetical protein B0T18DRAFT_244389 [Schizothecium vesticola]|uniref:Secreted protein n=1 Tax=Schizothecium vesticola TaxID=314040 RepID=A0AA40BQ78_9PEZI|nr:hypothetical protein B0T18DRAFT_244389 [Schizothecium vesticola]
MFAVPWLAMLVVATGAFDQHCIALVRFLHIKRRSVVPFRFHQIFNHKVSQSSLTPSTHSMQKVQATRCDDASLRAYQPVSLSH